MKTFNSLSFVAVVVILTSCGPTQKSANAQPDSQFQQTEQQKAAIAAVPLEVGKDLKSAPKNNIVFEATHKEETQSKYLTFKAPADGRLSISKKTTGFGIGCVEESKDKPYKMEYAYFLKDQNSGLYTGAMDPIYNDTRATLPTLRLRKDDDVQIRVDLTTKSDCESTTVTITATFKSNP